MIKRYSAPLLAVVFGVICAALEWCGRAFGYGTDLLPVSGAPWFPLVCAALVICTVLLIVTARRFKAPEGWQFEDFFAGDATILKLLSVIGGLLLVLGGLGGGMLTVLSGAIGAGTVPLLVLWLLAILSGGCCVKLASAQGKREMDGSIAALTIVPMLWATFQLIIVFKDNNVNPFLGRYLIDLLAAIGLMLAALYQCRFLYGKPMPCTFLFFAAFAVLCTVGAAGGTALSVVLPSVLSADAGDLMRVLCELGAAVFFLGQLIRMCAPRKQIYYWQD